MGSIPEGVSSAKLDGFDNYTDFLNYAKMLINLDKQEYRGLFNVLVKLQSIGEDPLETMLLWKKNGDEQDCQDMIRFMIHIDGLDLEEFKEAA